MFEKNQNPYYVITGIIIAVISIVSLIGINIATVKKMNLENADLQVKVENLQSRILLQTEPKTIFHVDWNGSVESYFTNECHSVDNGKVYYVYNQRMTRLYETLTDINNEKLGEHNKTAFFPNEKEANAYARQLINTFIATTSEAHDKKINNWKDQLEAFGDE